MEATKRVLLLILATSWAIDSTNGVQSIQTVASHLGTGADFLPIALRSASKTPLYANIGLRNAGERQFYGYISVGTPKQRMTVAFDTGSGCLVLSAKGCTKCMGINRYDSSLSSTATGVRRNKTFSMRYGSGKISGEQLTDKVWFSDTVAAPSVELLATTKQAASFQGFLFDGIVGLDLTILPGQSKDLFGIITKDNPKMKPVFAIYLTPDKQGGSEMSIGGYNQAKVQPGATFDTADVIPFPANQYNYWAVEMNYFRIGALEVNFCGNGCKAIIDSGTAYINVGAAQYSSVIKYIKQSQALKKHACSYDVGKGGFYCRGSKRTEFPALDMTMGANVRLNLEGKYYVQCDPSGCLVLLTRGSGGSGKNLWVFGDFFMRKYYTVFDRKNRQISFACAVGMCQNHPSHWSKQATERLFEMREPEADDSSAYSQYGPITVVAIIAVAALAISVLGKNKKRVRAVSAQSYDPV